MMSCQRVHEQVLSDFTNTAGQDSIKSQPANAYPFVSQIIDGWQNTQDSTRSLPAKSAPVVLQSTDGGQTWQDISKGLPEVFTPASFFADKDAVFLSAERGGVYRKVSSSNPTDWEKDIFLDAPGTTVSAGPGGVIAYGSNGRFFKRLPGTDIWQPVFADFKDHSVRTVFTAKDGSVFIGCDNGIFKSADQGNTWNHVMQDGWAIKMAEANGVLLCTNTRGILRSTDGGAHWDAVLSEGGVGIAVEAIEGGFAAITYNAESKTRRIRTSSDGGKTWQAIDAGIPPSQLISCIKQVGNSFYCGHPNGIYRSDDRGKTWKLLLPGIRGKVFNLSISGEVVYAVLFNEGC